MIDPLNQKIVDKLRADMDAAYPNEGTADLIAKYREYNPDYNRYTDEEITYMGETFPRHKGHILYENQWLPEGSKEFPWESMPWE